MKKNQAVISTAKFNALLNKIKTLEAGSKSAKIGKLQLSEFLLANADFPGEPKDVRTKRIILQIAGNYTMDPATLQGALKLKANLGYQSKEYSLLQIRLNKLVKEYVSSASVSAKEANACENVTDCVSLVNKKTTVPS